MKQYLLKAAQNWNIQELTPLKAPFLYAGLYQGIPVALKCIADTDSYLREKEALILFAKPPCVSLIIFDDQKQVLLLEKISPGTSLLDISAKDDEEATRIFLKVLQKLPRITSSYSFEIVEEYYRLIEKSNLIPLDIKERAKEMISFLKQLYLKSYLLHGDLHHENVLYSKEKGWLCIDPKGIIGPIEFEIALFLLNPLSLEPSIERFNKRCAIIHKELNIDRETLLYFACLRTLLGWIWSEEDNQSSPLWKKWIEIFIKTKLN